MADPGRTPPASTRRLTRTCSARGPTVAALEHTLYFRDARPPQHIQALLERQIDIALLPAAHTRDGAQRSARWLLGDARFEMTLSLDAVLPQTHAYSLSIHATPTEAATGWLAVSSKWKGRTQGWIDFWTMRLQGGASPASPTVDSPRRQALCRAWQSADDALQDAKATQRAIVVAMQHGSSFSTAHKEGGSRIAWQGGQFRHSTYGERESEQVFASEGDMLACVRRTFEHRVARREDGCKPDEAEVWRLILRQLDLSGLAPAQRDAQAQHRRLARWQLRDGLVVVAVLLLAGWMGWHRVHRGDSTLARAPSPVLATVPAPPAIDWEARQRDFARSVEAAKAAAAQH